MHQRTAHHIVLCGVACLLSTVCAAVTSYAIPPVGQQATIQATATVEPASGLHGQSDGSWLVFSSSFGQVVMTARDERDSEVWRDYVGTLPDDTRVDRCQPVPYSPCPHLRSGLKPDAVHVVRLVDPAL
jgi:hypothetical protein